MVKLEPPTCSICRGPRRRDGPRYCPPCKAAYTREWRKEQPTKAEVNAALRPYGLQLRGSRETGFEVFASLRNETVKHSPRGPRAN